MKALDDYVKARQEVFEHVGYVEDWRVLPLDDSRDMFWCLDGEGPGTVSFAEDEAVLFDGSGDHYENEIYTQRHLPKWVYRGPEFTMVVVDTHTDGNKFLQIFSNKLERQRPAPGVNLPAAPK